MITLESKIRGSPVFHSCFYARLSGLADFFITYKHSKIMDKVIEMLQKMAYPENGTRDEQLKSECIQALTILSAAKRAAEYGMGRNAYSEPVMLGGNKVELKMEAYPATLYAEMCDMINAG